MSPLHNPDKRGDVNDPTIEKISFTVEKIIEGDMAHSVKSNVNEVPLVEA